VNSFVLRLAPMPLGWRRTANRVMLLSDCVDDPVLACTSSEHFGRFGRRFKRASGASGLKVHTAIADPAVLVAAVPVIKRRTRNSDRRQSSADGQRRLFDQFDDLELLGSGVPHESLSPSPRTLFLSRRFSSGTSASVSLSWRASALRSSEVASRAVSPASRFLPASRNSFDHR